MSFKSAFIAILSVLFVHGLLLFIDGYGRFPQIDIPMHLFGGFAIAVLGLAIHTSVLTKHHNVSFPWWFDYLFIAGFVMLVGVLWEFHEFVLDQTVNVWYNLAVTQPSLADTMKDLLDDWIGASAAFWVFYKYKE